MSDVGSVDVARLSARLSVYPAILRLVSAQLCEWPEHAKFLDRSLSETDSEFLLRTNEIAELVWKLASAKIEQSCADYHWMCNNFVEEQIFFRRTRRYRLQTFEAAVKEVYGNPNYMGRYVNGILLSQVFWQNHARAIDLFRTRFLPTNRPSYDHLDVGPGHGLFLACTAADTDCKSVSGWDVSASSIDATRDAMKQLEIARPVLLVLQNVLEAPPQNEVYDSVIISEVLEHLERPERALETLRRAMKIGGRIFINVPVNSPAPDHIYLWRDPKEITNLVRSAGFYIDEQHHIPASGKTMDDAIRQNLDISCVIIAHK